VGFRFYNRVGNWSATWDERFSSANTATAVAVHAIDVPSGSKPQADKQDNGILGTMASAGSHSHGREKAVDNETLNRAQPETGEWVYPAKRGRTSKAQAVHDPRSR
jgi:hypothetical protein